MLVKIKSILAFVYQRSQSGAVALILVIMITALTIISAVVISMINTSDLMSSYSFSEAEEADVDIDACLEDALFRLASSTTASGNYYLTGVGTNCYYQIASSISGGLKIVTSTASSTSDIGYWQNTVVVEVNVSSTPISIYSYKNSNISYDSYLYCGDGTCNNGETSGTCSDDCVSAVCGNSIVESGETCDDGNTSSEACGDGVKQTGGAVYCNSTCTAVITRNEACDYTGAEALPDDPGCYFGDVGCTSRYTGCRNNCTACAFCSIEM